MSQLLRGGDIFIAVGSEQFNISDFATGVRSKCVCVCVCVHAHVCVCVCVSKHACMHAY